MRDGHSPARWQAIKVESTTFSAGEFLLDTLAFFSRVKGSESRNKMTPCKIHKGGNALKLPSSKLDTRIKQSHLLCVLASQTCRGLNDNILVPPTFLLSVRCHLRYSDFLSTKLL
jgi:hypothetical protein